MIPKALTNLIVLLFFFSFSGCHQDSSSSTSQQKDKPELKKLLRLEVPPAGYAYTGAYIDFGETEDIVTLEAMENFEKMVRKHQAIIAFSNYWGKQNFPERQLKIITEYGAVPLIYWSPWDHPYQEGTFPDRFNLHRILSGEWDNYIDFWAIQAKKYGKPMLVSWGLEMNGNWFPWSGVFYGGGKVIPHTNPPRYEGPEVYKKAYRYVVDRVRAQGAHNIQWIFHANNSSNPDEPWNCIANYYPGSEYVDWLGLSAFGQQYPGSGWISFEKTLPSYYQKICSLDHNKPFILAEWGVGEFPGAGDKGKWIAEAFRRIPVEFPRLKAAIFWHERWQNGDLSYSNLRVNSSEESLLAYREGVANPFWLDYPRFISIANPGQ
ncbi:MAG: glycoside hydrolase family 26 protein [Desulfobacterota bacterium]|nr:glycoside hydrolase family 26 protein [Thermodesulfobacteriota bacterium]